MKQGWIMDEYGGDENIGSKRHYVNGKLHSINDEPAIVLNNGYKAWMRDGNCHRDNGLPAVIHFDGTFVFVEDGIWLERCECGRFAKKYCPARKSDI